MAQGIHICDKAFAGSDTLATSYILYKALTKLILAEQNSEDNCNVIRLNLPAVVSFDNFTTKHPKISPIAMKKAKNKSIAKLGINADKTLCGLSGSKTQAFNIKDKLAKKTSEIVPDDPEEQAKLIIFMMTGEELNS